MAPKIVLRSKIDPSFSIEVGPQVIDSCPLLKNANNSEAVEVEMLPLQLQKFVEFHNHFEGPEADKDPEWTTEFFKEFTNDEFKDFCWNADSFGSQRFLEAAGDFVMAKTACMSEPEIREFFNKVCPRTLDPS